jgi:hypothetical protein
MSIVKVHGKSGSVVDQFNIPAKGESIIKLFMKLQGPHTVKISIDGMTHHVKFSKEQINQLHSDAHKAIEVGGDQNGEGIFDSIKKIASSVINNLPQIIDAGKGVVGAVQAARKGDYNGLVDAGKNVLNVGSKVYGDYKNQSGGSLSNTMNRLQNISLDNLPNAKPRGVRSTLNSTPTVYSESEKKIMSDVAMMRGVVLKYLISELSEGILMSKHHSNPNSKYAHKLSGIDKAVIRDEAKKRMTGIPSYTHGGSVSGSKRQQITGVNPELYNWFDIANNYLKDPNIVKYGIRKQSGYNLFIKENNHSVDGDSKDRLIKLAASWKQLSKAEQDQWSSKADSGLHANRIHTVASAATANSR